MPYPSDTPLNKHDLKCPSFPPEGMSLLDEFGFATTAELFQALKQEARTDLKRIASVYSYNDAPPQPLSRDLLILGVADVSLSVVRRLVGDDDEIPDCLHRCTIAVKRIDGSYARHLKESDFANSKAFANLMRRLKLDDVVAILGQDKYGRFGILKPSEHMNMVGDYTEEGFLVSCYVGNVAAVKEFLTQGMEQSVVAVQPAGSFRHSPEPDMQTGGLWQPPGEEQDNDGDADADFSWKPPGSADADEPAFNFASSSNGLGAWQPVDHESNGAGQKRKRNEDYDNGGEGGSGGVNEFHADSGAAAADAFYSKLTRSLDTRADSRIFHMRAFNGWVKATQIQELDPKTRQPGKKQNGPLRVLDLACGKGGDLGKWTIHGRGIANYVGIDVARGSLRDAAIRARQMRQKLKRCTFTCADLGADVPGRYKSSKHKQMQKLLTWSLQNEPAGTTAQPDFGMTRGGGISLGDKFDVVSIQFAIHYMMSSKKRARRFFQTVSELLEVGGNLIATTIDARVVIDHMNNLGLDLHFDKPENRPKQALISVGGGACRICFQPDIVERIYKRAADATGSDERLFGLEYTFTLVEGSDHDAGVGDAVNLPEWLTPIPVLEALANEAGLELEYAQNFHEFYAARKDPSAHALSHGSLYSMKVLNRNGSISVEEWEISRLYAAVSFRKVRESTVEMKDSYNEPDDEDEDEVDAEENLPEIDAMKKAKLLPMALLKLKKGLGNDAWNKLSSEEKTRLADIEVRKMAAK